MPPGRSANLHEVYGDLQRRETWNELLPGVDLVFHLAATEFVYGDAENPEADWRANVSPGIQLLESCRTGIWQPRIVFTSSANIFGQPDSLPVSESAASRPQTTWGVHKLLMEQYLRVYAERHGIRSSSLRLSNIYGPPARPEVFERVVINKVLARAFRGQQLVTYQNRKRLRDYIYIDDVVRALLYSGIASDSFPGACYVLGSGVGTSFEEAWGMISEFVRTSTGSRIDVVNDDAFKLDILEDRDFVADTSLFRERTGWSARVHLEDGLALTAAALESS